MLLDLPRRRFTLLGATFLPTDTLLFALLFVGAILTIFLVSALVGRVWCGWACPQTVYMEFLFRPLERWIEGGWHGSKKLDRTPGFKPRRVLKLAIYGVLALFLAHTFLAYFVPVGELLQWMRRSPVQHPTSFLTVLGTTVAIFLDFAWFREQTCLVACPYGRLQSALLDRRSLIVGYDARRGEPRRKGVLERPADAGDCIDCKLCVLTCPTGIDIREGLQMECVHCTQCMDACDAVMVRIGKPPGLIRYSSREGLEGRHRPILRARVALYAAAVIAVFGAFGFALAARPDTDVTLLREAAEPFTVETDGQVVNPIRIKVANHAAVARHYVIALEGAPGARLIAPLNPLPVAAGGVQTTIVFVAAPRAVFHDGMRDVTFRIDDGARYHAGIPYRLIGPEEDEHGRDDRREPGAGGEH